MMKFRRLHQSRKNIILLLYIMAIGLKLRDIRRFGTKLQKGVNTFARKLSKTADVVGSIATPIATVVAGPEGALAVKGAVEGVKGIAKGAQRLTGKGIGKGTELFKQIQQPVLGARELVGDIKSAVQNPKTAQIRIGDTIVRRFGGKAQPSIQREGEVMNEWAPDLPFATM